MVGQTQIGMLSTDESAKDNPDGAYIACGDDFPCVVKDYTVETFGSASSPDKDNYYTTYSFAIKNGIKFSDGSDLTIKDVLFNMYVLLDPAYTGSSTLYSVDIKGLTEYRTQSTDSSEQSDKIYYAEARIRIGVITAWCDEAIELQNPNEFDAKYEELKEIDEEKHKELTGYTNQNILEMARFLSDHGTDMWIRHVLVPGLTDDPEGLKRTREFIDSLKTVKRVEVLPYHTLGKFKWEKLGIAYPLEGVRTPTAEEVKTAEELLGIVK